jgi:hypothetical protein
MLKAKASMLSGSLVAITGRALELRMKASARPTNQEHCSTYVGQAEYSSVSRLTFILEANNLPSPGLSKLLHEVSGLVACLNFEYDNPTGRTRPWGSLSF